MERSQTSLRMDLVSYPENSFDSVLHLKGFQYAIVFKFSPLLWHLLFDF